MLRDVLDRIHGRYISTPARSFCRRPVPLEAKGPVISFTFDDFPRSALHNGGEILRRQGLRATYYVSLGLLGQQEPTGTICGADDLNLVLQQGHELGCHTFHHCDSWYTNPSVFMESVCRNQAALAEMVPGYHLRSFSYPINPPRAKTKRAVGGRFLCARGGGQKNNSGTVDANYLAAYFLEKSRGDRAAVKEVIEHNRRSQGWLILATHDIDLEPTPYGCTPDFFSDIARYAVDSGARVMPVAEAFEALTGVSVR